MNRYLLLTILALALVLRFAAAVAVTWVVNQKDENFLIPGDANGYWQLADQIQQGEPYEIYHPPRRVMRMPGFPALIAACRLLTDDSFLGTRLLLAGVGTLACGAVYLLGRELVSRSVGLTAAFLAAVNPVFTGFSVLILSETAFALFLTLSLAAMAALVANRSSRFRTTVASHDRSFPSRVLFALTTGFLIALATYVRPTWLPAALIFPAALWMACPSLKRFLLAATIIFAVVAALLPWTIRNHSVTGHWIPTTLWVGPSLYDGLHPGATGASDMRFFDEERLLETMSEYEMDRVYRERAWDFVKAEPGRAIELGFIKLWRFWRPWPGAEQFSNWPAQWTVALSFLPLLGLAILGGWIARADFWLLGLTIVPILVFSLVHCLFVSSLRYRLPVEYPLCVLAAIGVHALVNHFRDKKTQAA